ncbi:MAG TPA: hypothetical protein VMZ92_03025 [Planctomycetota bacterium]|nr:hypothetical protein [Planctomycetota bacterium]
MARTKDPHAATVKAWKTRARNASNSGTTQQSGDFAALPPEVQHGVRLARTWPKERPWAATRERLASGVAGVRYNPNLQSEARNLGGRYEVGPKFFALDVGGREHVLYHELGHDLSDQMLRDGSAWGALDLLDTVDGYRELNGQTTPGEVVAEAYAQMRTDRIWLERRAPGLVRLVSERAAHYGFP